MVPFSPGELQPGGIHGTPPGAMLRRRSLAAPSFLDGIRGTVIAYGVDGQASARSYCWLSRPPRGSGITIGGSLVSETNPSVVSRLCPEVESVPMEKESEIDSPAGEGFPPARYRSPGKRSPRPVVPANGTITTRRAPAKAPGRRRALRIEARKEDAVPRKGPGRRAGARGRQALEALVAEESLTDYLKELDQFKPLTHLEEIELSKAIQKGDQKALTRLIQCNLRLVVYSAKKYLPSGIPLEDLLQEGNQGLMRAAQRFDHRKGTRFSTFAVWWIRQTITRSIVNLRRTIQVPLYLNEVIGKYVGTRRLLAQRSGREPSPEEIAEHLGWKVERVRRLARMLTPTVSLDAEIKRGPATVKLRDIVMDVSLQTPTERAEQECLRRNIDGVLRRLKPREALIVRLRYGMDGGPPMTFAKVGEVLGLSRERVRQIEVKAIQKLKICLKGLKVYH